MLGAFRYKTDPLKKSELQIFHLLYLADVFRISLELHDRTRFFKRAGSTYNPMQQSSIYECPLLRNHQPIFVVKFNKHFFTKTFYRKNPTFQFFRYLHSLEFRNLQLEPFYQPVVVLRC